MVENVLSHMYALQQANDGLSVIETQPTQAVPEVVNNPQDVTTFQGNTLNNQNSQNEEGIHYLTNFCRHELLTIFFEIFPFVRTHSLNLQQTKIRNPGLSCL